MSTFQAIIYGMIEGISEFLPISSKAHHLLFPYLVGWQPPTGALLGAITLGALLSLLVYFRHDWASIVSCFLQVVIFRKRPMTLDERLPIFLLISTLPLVFVSYYFHDRVAQMEWSPLQVASILLVTAVPLWLFDRLSRKSKGMFDWNWLDAGIVGLGQALSVLPGWDSMSGIMIGALFMNYKAEAAAKYGFFALLPILLSRSITHLQGLSFQLPTPMPDLSWFSFAVALIVAFLVGLLAIGGFLRHLQEKSVSQYALYRGVVAVGIGVVYWARAHL